MIEAPPPAAAARAAAAATSSNNNSNDLHFPPPVFEGSEKRLEIDFYAPDPASAPARGLRAIPRAELDALLADVSFSPFFSLSTPPLLFSPFCSLFLSSPTPLSLSPPLFPPPLSYTQASCCVVSVTSNDRTDSYVLSESSLFVSNSRVVLKTCGTTRLLEAIPRTLEAARAHSGLLPCRVKYSRASFLFPDAQPAPHHDFAAETAQLRQHFGHLTANGSGVSGGKGGGSGGGGSSGGGGGGGGAYVLGDALSGLQWHVFVADASAAAAAAEAAAALLASESAAAAAAASPSPSAAAAAALLLSGAPSKLLAAAAGGAANATAAALAGRARRGAGGNGPLLLRGASVAAAAAAAEAAAAAAPPGSSSSSLPPLPRLPSLPSSSPTYTLEVCMMGLDPARAALFSRGSGANKGEGEGGGGGDAGEFAGASTVTAASGLRALLPSALVDDFVFDPCGYSMNALDGAAFATVHVTPEEACSYASLELCGYCPEALCPSAVVARAAAIFGPRRMAVAMSVDADVAFCPWLLSSLSFPQGYGFDGAAAQDFGGRGRTAFYCLVKHEEGEEEEEDSEEDVEEEIGAAAAPVAAASSCPPSEKGNSDDEDDDLSHLTTAAFVASPPPGSTACGVAVKAAAAAAAAASASGEVSASAASAATSAPAPALASASSSPLSPLSRPATGESDEDGGAGGEGEAAAAPAAAAAAAASAAAAAGSPPSPRGPLRLSPSLFSTTSSLAAALTAAEGGGRGPASGSSGSGSDEEEAAAAARRGVEAAAALLAAAAFDHADGGGGSGSSSSDEGRVPGKAPRLQQQRPPSPPRPARTPSPVAQAPPPPRAPTPRAAAVSGAATAAAAAPEASMKKKKRALPSVPFSSSSSRPSHHPPRPFLPRCASAAALATLLEPRAPSAAGGASAALVPAVAAAAGANASSPSKTDSGAIPAAPRRPPAPAPLSAVLAASRAARLPRGDERSLHAALSSAIEAHALEDNVYAVDLGAVARAHAAWTAAMPRVEPFYAVKCNPDPAIVATLAALGAGFDCASAAEVELVLSLGVRPHRVVFANACKRPADVRAAAASGVDLTTFDTSGELRKLAALHPNTRALLRLRADDPAARCQLGNKYGAEPGEAARSLLREALRLGVRVVGVSFHVGSGASDPAAFAAAIGLAREAFDDGLALGFEMDLLDVGGGFAAPTAIVVVGGGGGGEGGEEAAAVSSSGATENSNLLHHLHHRHHFSTTNVSTTDASSDSSPPSPLETSLDPATGHTRVPALGLDLGPAPAAVNAALERHFPTGCGVRVIAEPGRYYAEGAATLACAVYGSRDGHSLCECGCDQARETRDYWITDGLYGSMNCVLYDHATLSCKKLEFGSCSSSSGRKVLGFAARPPAFDGDSSDDDEEEEEEEEGDDVEAESIEGGGSGASTPGAATAGGGGGASSSSASAPVPPSTPPPSAGSCAQQQQRDEPPSCPSSSSSSPPPSSSCCAEKRAPLPKGWLLSTVFGPTCDGLDTVLRDEPLPRLRAGRDWVAFPRMGAYTLAGASAFNGFDATAPAVVYVWSERG